MSRNHAFTILVSIAIIALPSGQVYADADSDFQSGVRRIKIELKGLTAGSKNLKKLAATTSEKDLEITVTPGEISKAVERFENLPDFPLYSQSDFAEYVTPIYTKDSLVLTGARFFHVDPRDPRPYICAAHGDEAEKIRKQILALAPGANITFPKKGCYPNSFGDVHLLLKSEYEYLKKNIGSQRLELLGMMKMSEHSAYGRGLKEEIKSLTEDKIGLENKIDKETAFAGYSEYQADEKFQSKIRKLQLELERIDRKISLWEQQLKNIDRHTVAVVKFISDGKLLGMRTTVRRFPSFATISDKQHPYGCIVEGQDTDFGEYLARLLKLMEAVGLIPVQKTRDRDTDKLGIYSFFRDKPVNIFSKRVHIINFKYLDSHVTELRGKPAEKDYDYGAHNAIKNYLDRHEIPYFILDISYAVREFYYPSYVEFGRTDCTSAAFNNTKYYKDAEFIYVPPYPRCPQSPDDHYDPRLYANVSAEERNMAYQSWKLLNMDKKKHLAERSCWWVKWDLDIAPEKQKRLRKKFEKQY
jgi:hypothetical protein